MKQIDQMHTPRDKTTLITKVGKILQDLFSLTQDKNKHADTDKTQQLFSYLLFKANLPNLHNHLKYIQVFGGSQKGYGEHMFFLNAILISLGYLSDSLNAQTLSMTEEEFELKILEQEK